VPKQPNAAFVLVSQNWWSTVAPLLAASPPPSTAPVVRLLGPFVSQDAAGIWLGQVPANLTRTKSGSHVMMSLLIPWEQIIALGAIEESRGLKPGFAALSVEDVRDSPDYIAPRGPGVNPTS
jgi:hypothetical protein